MKERTKTYEEGDARGNWKFSFELSENPPLISQYFISLEGEGSAVGEPSAYLRLAGCFSCHCTFCDTAFSQISKNSRFKEIGDRGITLDLAKQMETSQPHRLTITGGEPLHYLEWFPDIYRWIDSIAPTGIEFLGIESNGNLLQSRDICLELISSFNEIINEYSVTPTLTISPKLDAATCYDNQMTQDEVDRMYMTAFKNVSEYLQPYDIYYKFIYDHTEEFIDFDHQQIFIDYLIDELNVKHRNILLMPFTPEDPLGSGKIFWNESKNATSRKALKLGLTYSPRIHIDRELD